jgi:hypothetical protein
MTVFSGDFNPVPWLREKTLLAVQSAVSLIDVANEPDTTPWYKRKLLSIAEQLLDRLLPVVAYLYQTESPAADREEWGSILEGGSFAFAAWCKKWKVADATSVGRSSLRHLRTVEEHDEKAEELPQHDFEGDFAQAADLKLQIYSSMTRRLVHSTLTTQAQRFMLWLLGNLWLSEPADVVGISKRFLPTDIGLSNEEAASAYKELFDTGWIERVDLDAEQRPEYLCLRLVIQGVNDSRHASTFHEESFGYPGSRIAGKVTSGQGKPIDLSEAISESLVRWHKTDQELANLCNALQLDIGENRIYVERAELNLKRQKPELFVYFRYPIDADLKALEKEVDEFSQSWLKQQAIKS